MKKLTELDKLECAEYTIKLLDDELTNHGAYNSVTGDWLRRAKDEVRNRRSQYLDNTQGESGE